MESERAGQLLERLRSDGQRLTVARRALVEALVSAPGHVCADDLAMVVQASHPGVHRATVYRVLDVFERLGIVEHVHLGHGPAVYHLTDQLHHHLVCEDCGAVSEVPAQTLVGFQRRVLASEGFQLHPYHFALTGHCRTCVSQSKAAHR